MTTAHQASLDIAGSAAVPQRLGDYVFEPIRGFPMLTWRGKRPFTSAQYYPAQLKEVHGDAQEGWRNKIFWGDNLQVMSHLLKDFRGKIHLIYVDPPFDSRADYKRRIDLRGKRVATSSSAFEEKQYTDLWTNDEYLQFMYERLVLMRELLAESGTIYLHCDSGKGHHLRCLLDEIFGPNNFINEVTWHYYNKMAPDSKCFPRASDKILSFAKSIGTHTFHKQIELRDKPVKQLLRKFVDGKAINVRDESGNVLYRESSEKRVDDVWRMSMLQPADKTENTGYPTQKPETVIERIVRASSNEGDIVFDCFMGAGTTQAVAMRLGRRFIGADINLGAVQTTTKRLLKIASTPDELELEVDKRYLGFEVFNVNYYDVFRNPVEARELLLSALEVNQLERGSIFDGEKDGRLVKVMPINRIATRADLNEIVTGLDYKAFERRHKDHPNQAVEKVTLVCMGHERDLAAHLQHEVKPYKLDVQVVDVLRDKADLQFKRDSTAKVTVKKGELLIERFYPMNLLQKLSMQKEGIKDWRELVESVMVDWNYDGAVFQPKVVDVPRGDDLVAGHYKAPDDAGTIRVKITDLLSESWEGSISDG